MARLLATRVTGLRPAWIPEKWADFWKSSKRYKEKRRGVYWNNWLRQVIVLVRSQVSRESHLTASLRERCRYAIGNSRRETHRPHASRFSDPKSKPQSTSLEGSASSASRRLWRRQQTM
jgi:hypothetical protein